MILVVFASKSNKAVYDRVVAELKRLEVPFELRIFSAHKTPHQLEEVLGKKRYSVIIAGAGMAAHLAGAIAAKHTTPVIGVPCGDNFEGLDALLSTLQMPPGVPVLTVGVDQAEEAAKYAFAIEKGIRKAYLLVKIKQAEKTADHLKKLLVPYEFSYSLQDDGINIRFVELKDIAKIKDEGKLTINVPISETATVAKDALTLLKVKHGLWVSLNRIDNAAIAVAEIVGKENELKQSREDFAKAVLATDEEESKWQSKQ